MVTLVGVISANCCMLNLKVKLKVAGYLGSTNLGALKLYPEARKRQKQVAIGKDA